MRELPGHREFCEAMGRRDQGHHLGFEHRPLPGARHAERRRHLVVRDGLGLTGAKAVCRTGVCGACTGMVGGTPQASCLLPAAVLEEREIVTAEGLDHPVQRAFAVHDGLQCGYCTPGFVVEAAAFVDAWRAEHGDVAPAGYMPASPR